MTTSGNYESVMGLEVHMQLSTRSKAYSNDPVTFGELPNTQVSPVTLGHPGTLPVHNRKVVEFAIRLGLAVGSEIRRENQYARKNYFYPDLPKGYQITQDHTPICTGGKIEIKNPQTGQKKTIKITRIHMEEDAGKSIHDLHPDETLVDLNRAGVPLLEIVSEPDFREPWEVYAYLAEVRKLVRYLEICDGNMEEGSLRCDANVSVRKIGDTKLGQRTEVKNMNSLRNVQRAVEYEIERQIEEVEKGNPILMETRSFDATQGTTFAMRTKELANDYRYFPEPDLQPLLVEKDMIEVIRASLPPLPNALLEKYMQLGLSEYDAGVITETKGIALYFEELLVSVKNVKMAANWVMVGIKSYLNEKAVEISQFPISPAHMAQLISMIDEGKISHTAAAQKLFPLMLQKPDEDPANLANRANLMIQTDPDLLEKWVEEAVKKFPEKVNEFKSGKTGLLGLFMGEVMKLSKGKADPKAADLLLRKTLSN